LRIGINLGDVIVEGDDLYGDGVNIAARVEALADAGGVFVSNTVHDQVRDRLPFLFEDLDPSPPERSDIIIWITEIDSVIGAAAAESFELRCCLTGPTSAPPATKLAMGSIAALHQ